MHATVTLVGAMHPCFEAHAIETARRHDSVRRLSQQRHRPDCLPKNARYMHPVGAMHPCFEAHAIETARRHDSVRRLSDERHRPERWPVSCTCHEHTACYKTKMAPVEGTAVPTVCSSCDHLIEPFCRSVRA